MALREWCADEGKISYPTAGDAWSALAWMGKRQRERKGSAYRCPKCQGWHLTSKPKSARDEMRHAWRRFSR